MLKALAVASAFIGLGGLSAIIVGGAPALAASFLCTCSALGLSVSVTETGRYRLGLTAGLRIGRALGRQDAKHHIR
ncbi:hypothetical protein J5X84_36420 [Streptosporangiaceae bacterium NEAU-GS5]|nr:hypothetical protein [Streptosporangiaceae bacterium NEAU-GS5]